MYVLYHEAASILQVSPVTNNSSMADFTCRSISRCTSSRETRKQCRVLDMTIFLSLLRFSSLYFLLVVLHFLATEFSLFLTNKVCRKSRQTQTQKQSHFSLRTEAEYKCVMTLRVQKQEVSYRDATLTASSKPHCTQNTDFTT
jgi:hypothetical protein